MGRYIKSYSNYVLKKKHQTVNDGVIYERDITTIGGRDQFAKGQIPIYRSGNFLITTNNDNSSYKKTTTIAWEKNDTGEDVWTLDVLDNYEKDEKSSFDEKIVIKKDYYDLRDFAYYGSCSELIRSSINNILKTYPGELYIPVIPVWISNDGIMFYSEEAAIAYAGENNYSENYTSLEAKYTDTSKEAYEEAEKKDGNPHPILRDFELPDGIDNGKNANLFLISNPFNIDVHSETLPTGADILKYFAEEGYKNYVGYKNIDGEWNFDEPLIVIPGKYEPYCPEDYCDDEQNLHFQICLNYCPGDYMGKIEICFYKQPMKSSVAPTELTLCEDCDGKVEGSIKIEFEKDEDVDGVGVQKVYEECKDGSKIAGFKMQSLELDGCITVYVFMGDNGEIKYFVDLTPHVQEGECDDNGDLIVGTIFGENGNYRIRPNDKIITDYYNNLDIFERLLLDNGNSFTSYFEVINDDEYGYFTKIEKFVFPTTYGGYNLGSNGAGFSKFLEGLIEIGEYYDERFSDNLWRSMTHESIKNFDWTYTRHYTPGDEHPYVEGGEKIQKVIRLYGREFDEIKSYIDNISNVNTVTYNNVNNLPDYFFTDKLEDDGWDVRLINPLKLTEYIDGYEIEIPEDNKEISELTNEYNCKKLERVFNYDFDIQHIKPYSKDKIDSIINTKCGEHDVVSLKVASENCIVETGQTGEFCEDNGDLSIVGNVSLNGKITKFNAEIVKRGTYADDLDFHVGFNDGFIDECVNCHDPKEYELLAETGEAQRDGYHDDCCNLVKIYSSEKEYKMSEINSEFLKRFILNSKEILRHKGTIEGIEMLLGLFGLRSKNYVLTNETYFKQDPVEEKEYEYDNRLTIDGERYYKKKNINTKAVYDYDIKEYTLFTTRLEDTYDTNKKMYHYDWINSIKLNAQREYESYDGLPVMYRSGKTADDETVRYLYPSFQSGVKYDGNPYYQMNGGWLSKKPFMFDVNNNIIPANFDFNNRRSNTLFTETIRNIKCVQTLRELLGNKSLAINSGDICQVVDLSGRFAIVDGVVYDLFDETDVTSYFYVTIENNSLTVGNAFFTDYVYISNPYAIDGKKKYNLNDNSNNGRDIKVYVIKKEDGTYDIDVHSNSNSITTFTVFENGKYMEGNNFTNYFRVNNPNFFNELSVVGWQQLRDNEYEYYIMNSIVDNNKGNNPHTGHMNYDNGHEYLTYFSKLFKHSYDNSLFDSRKMTDEDPVYDDVFDYGFKNLIDEDDCNKNYDEFLKEDTKCHYFGDFITSAGTYVTYDKENKGLIEHSYSMPKVPRKPVLSFDNVDVQFYGEGAEGTIDGITNQIVNTKRVDIDFFITSETPYSNEWLEEVKYIDSVILPYLSQILPSTIICTINYKQNNICK